MAMVVMVSDDDPNDGDGGDDQNTSGWETLLEEWCTLSPKCSQCEKSQALEWVEEKHCISLSGHVAVFWKLASSGSGGSCMGFWQSQLFPRGETICILAEMHFNGLEIQNAKRGREP